MYVYNHFAFLTVFTVLRAEYIVLVCFFIRLPLYIEFACFIVIAILKWVTIDRITAIRCTYIDSRNTSYRFTGCFTFYRSIFMLVSPRTWIQIFTKKYQDCDKVMLWSSFCIQTLCNTSNICNSNLYQLAVFYVNMA